MNTDRENKVVQLLLFGLLLAAIKFVYTFFDPYNILDFILFVLAGFLIGNRVPAKQRLYGLLLALPACILCLLFVINLGYKSIQQGIGTSYAISLVVIPLATTIGLLLQATYSKMKNNPKNK